ncbi:MAG: thiamine phosphate synthase [Pirellulaceae bacterium]
MSASTNETSAVWRIIDSSLNRVAEGLRTAEEFARFVLNDPLISEQIKALRHEVGVVGRRFPRQALQTHRDTVGDVGVAIKTPDEWRRSSATDIAIAALSRVQQSLRCLEEYSKLVDVKAAAEFETIRYRTYTVSAAMENLNARRKRLSSCRLYLLIDGQQSSEAMARLMLEMANTGVDAIQLRDKSLNDRDLFERASIAAQVLRPTKCLFIVNDRADIAIGVNADGLHLGQEELPITAARRIVGDEMLIGISTHDLDQAKQAVLSKADYIGCGPTFPSRTKSFQHFAGLRFLKDVAAQTSIPAFAIGGIDLTNVDQVVETGFRRIAVAGSILHHPSPTNAVEEFSRILSQASGEGNE